MNNGKRRLLLASHNLKKMAELQAILQPLDVVLCNLTSFPGAPVPEETAPTFSGNAIIKACSALEHTGLPSLADDSGLEVGALGGEPGVRSARFAGEQANDAENNRLLLARLAAVPPEKRTARFVSVIALALPGGEVRTFHGEATGTILSGERGEGGFGYDPLFLSDALGMTFAEAAPEAKNRISHRARALVKLMDELREGLLESMDRR